MSRVLGLITHKDEIIIIRVGYLKKLKTQPTHKGLAISWNDMYKGMQVISSGFQRINYPLVGYQYPG
jgi:hypothetical protein